MSHAAHTLNELSRNTSSPGIAIPGSTPSPPSHCEANAAPLNFAPIDPAPTPDPDPAVEPPVDRRQNQNFSGVDKRKNIVDRRTGLDRRFVDIGSPTGLERRRGPGRRLNENRKSAEEGEMTDEQFEFLMAIDTYKKINHRAFPTWTEVLEVVKQLGYRKVAASTIKLPNSNGRPTQP